MTSLADTAEFVAYADDVAILLSGSKSESMGQNANTFVSSLQSWAVSNFLKINATKTKAVLFRPRDKTVNKISEL